MFNVREYVDEGETVKGRTCGILVGKGKENIKVAFGREGWKVGERDSKSEGQFGYS